MFILRFLIVAVATAMVSSFLSSHLSVRVKTALNGDVFYDNSCEDRLKDPNGRYYNNHYCCHHLSLL